jgi:hypothetical protein
MFQPAEPMSLFSSYVQQDRRLHTPENAAASPQKLQAAFEYHSSRIVLDLTDTPDRNQVASDSVIDLCTPSPIPNLTGVKHEAIDIDIIDLTNSPIQPKPTHPLPC